jgi:hypothetical protein
LINFTEEIKKRKKFVPGIGHYKVPTEAFENLTSCAPLEVVKRH